MNLFVAGLPYDLDDYELKQIFEEYGEVSSAKVILDKETRKSRGFGFVEMPDSGAARQAIEALDGADLSGKKMAVKEAEERKPNNNFGGNRGGGGGRDNNRYGNRY